MIRPVPPSKTTGSENAVWCSLVLKKSIVRSIVEDIRLVWHISQRLSRLGCLERQTIKSQLLLEIASQRFDCAQQLKRRIRIDFQRGDAIEVSVSAYRRRQRILITHIVFLLVFGGPNPPLRG